MTDQPLAVVGTYAYISRNLAYELHETVTYQDLLSVNGSTIAVW
jgi:hypothetical protein